MNKNWSGNNRAPWHDYKRRCLYHITLLKSHDCPDFGRIAGSSAVPAGTHGSPFVAASSIGKAIKEALRRLPEIHNALRLMQYALMPDHLHLLLSVENSLDEHLGLKIAVFKSIVNDLAGRKGVFANGYNDQIITSGRDLTTIFRYIRENPYRLLVRLEHPEYFRRALGIRFGGRRLCAYGNLALLRNPFRHQVVVHRADPPDKLRRNRELWLYAAANGGVLVSPFISPVEKRIRAEAEERGGRIILIVNDMIGDRYKPAAHDFSLCESGRLLLLAPAEAPSAAKLDRNACLAMNSLASIVANH